MKEIILSLDKTHDKLTEMLVALGTYTTCSQEANRYYRKRDKSHQYQGNFS